MGARQIIENNGYCVVEEGVLHMKTVSPTRRGSIIRFLQMSGVPVHKHYTDDQIDGLWDRNNDGAQIRKVCCVVVE